ncbi:MAG: amidohydrolase family protein, partial [Planctomycetota bacterium]
MPLFKVLSSAVCVSAAAMLAGAGQPSSDSPLSAPANGPRVAPPDRHVLHAAFVHTEPGTMLEDAAIVIEGGEIVGVFEDARRVGDAPARHWHYPEHHVYAGFIDAHQPVGAPMLDDDAPRKHWNELVTPERRAIDGDGLSDSDKSSLHKLGFTAAAIAPDRGIFAGRAAVVSLNPMPSVASGERPRVYIDEAYDAMGFDRNTRRNPLGNYPGSQMGVIALTRQTLSDMAWGDETGALDVPERITSPVWRTDNELEALRAITIAREFDVPCTVVGSGTEFRRLDALVDANSEREVPLIVPLAFANKPDVSSVGKAEAVSLRALMTWEQSPTNPRRLHDAGLTVALTASGMPDGQRFDDNLTSALKHGLDAEAAHAMLTTTPAELLGLSGTLGRIAPGHAASFVVTTADYFDHALRDDMDIADLWIDGVRHELTPPEPPTIDGRWAIGVPNLGEGAWTAHLDIDGDDIVAISGLGTDAEVRADTRRVQRGRDGTVSFLLDNADEPVDDRGTQPVYVMSGTLTDLGGTGLQTGARPGQFMRGSGLGPTGETFQWRAERLGDVPDPTNGEDESRNDSAKDEDEASEDDFVMPPDELPGYPFGAYATTLPEQDTYVLANATVWTASDDSDAPIENTTVIVRDGKIVTLTNAGTRVGRDPDDVRIDSTGLHITPGIIDAHSHTGISFGVNEAGQACTAEVRIGDVTNPDAISWYRQLAAGVTSVNSMHGSANPIGGQTQTNKIRWGAVHPNDMHMQGAKPGIKFALGENVKQSNWGSDYNVRYPQTRMGVETFMRDRFEAAQQYDPATDRRDLELEALREILRGERLIHCHSYRQDEIVMLCDMANDYGFTIGTFQHGLEVYKVAEHVREAAIGASLFSDWWAYKYEVVDAIPHAGPI